MINVSDRRNGGVSMVFDETVTINDRTGATFRLSISTPTQARLSFELMRNSDFVTWRPSFWGGDWKVLDPGKISYSKGTVWYKRTSGDYRNGIMQPSDIRHLGGC